MCLYVSLSAVALNIESVQRQTYYYSLIPTIGRLGGIGNGILSSFLLSLWTRLRLEPALWQVLWPENQIRNWLQVARGCVLLLVITNIKLVANWTELAGQAHIQCTSPISRLSTPCGLCSSVLSVLIQRRIWRRIRQSRQWKLLSSPWATELLLALC